MSDVRMTEQSDTISNMYSQDTQELHGPNRRAKHNIVIQEDDLELCLRELIWTEVLFGQNWKQMQ